MFFSAIFYFFPPSAEADGLFMSYHSAVSILFLFLPLFLPYCFYGGNVAGLCSAQSVSWARWVEVGSCAY